MFIFWMIACSLILDMTSAQGFSGQRCCMRGVGSACYSVSSSNNLPYYYCLAKGYSQCRNGCEAEFNGLYCCRSKGYELCTNTMYVPPEKEEECKDVVYRTCDNVCTKNCCQKVVKDRCSAQAGGNNIPTDVTVPCETIGYSLCYQTDCSFDTIKNVTNPSYNQNNCCREVVTNLCNGAPGEVTLPNGVNVNVRQKCLTDGYKSCLETHTCSWSCSEKVLTELCSGNFMCLKTASQFTDSTLISCNEGDNLTSCKNSVVQLCESGTVPYNSDVCKTIGGYLCMRN